MEKKHIDNDRFPTTTFGNDGLTEQGLPEHGALDPSGPLLRRNDDCSTCVVIPECFCRGSVVMKQSNDINDRFPTTTFGNDGSYGFYKTKVFLSSICSLFA